MADLDDLKAVGEKLVPILKDLFSRLKQGKDKTSRTAEDAVIERLKKVVTAANKKTPADIGERAAAIVATRGALIETMIQAASNPESISETKARIINKQLNTLKHKYGLLLEMSVFANIAKLLTATEITRYSKNLKKAKDDVASREKAKQLINTMVDVAIVAAKIAAKVA